MAELHPDSARSAARTAIGYARSFDGKDINWQSDEPWPHRIELAQALDWITELGAMVLNLSDRVPTDTAQTGVALIMNDEQLRFGVRRLKRLISLREPPYELPADSFLEAAVRDIWTAAIAAEREARARTAPA